MANKIQKDIDILLEVNIADEESKQGFDQKDIFEAMNLIHECPHIHVKGLMMMAPNIDPEETRIYFKKTKELLETLKNKYPEYSLDTLSMGMSQDYQIALEEGSSFVRIGRALFQ